MKKIQLVLGLFFIGNLFLGGHLKAEGSENDPFVYIPDANLRKNMFERIDNTSYYQSYSLFSKSELSNPNFIEYDNERTITSLEDLQYANNLKVISQESVCVIDYRPLRGLDHLEELSDYGSNAYSIDFLCIRNIRR